MAIEEIMSVDFSSYPRGDWLMSAVRLISVKLLSLVPSPDSMIGLSCAVYAVGFIELV